MNRLKRELTNLKSFGKLDRFAPKCAAVCAAFVSLKGIIPLCLYKRLGTNAYLRIGTRVIR